MTTTPEPNVDLFIDVLAHIERDPDSWNQSWWAIRGVNDCGTTYCFAGHACVASGFEPAWMRGYNLSSFTGDGGSIADTAQDLLGLTIEQRSELFNAPNDLSRIYDICADIVGVAPEVLRDKVKDHLG